MPKKLSDISKIHRQQQIYNILRHCSESSALTVTEICHRLIRDGIDVSSRTVNRDLEEMSETHKLVTTGSMPMRFYTSEHFTPNYQLNFNEEELQTILLALESLKSMSSDYMKDLCHQTEITLLGKLPRDVLEDVKILKSLSSVNGSILGQAIDKDKDTFALVMKALRNGQMIECENHSPTKSDDYNTQKRVFSPLLLNISGGETYLFIHDEYAHKNKKVKISRLRNIRILDKKFDRKHILEIKNLDKQIGGFGGGDEPIIQYEITCTQVMAKFFEERKIHHSQSIIQKGGNYLISFEANNSLEIVRFLAGFGEFIIDVKPDSTYRQLKEIWKKGLKVS